MARALFWTLVIIQVVGIIGQAYMIGRPRKPVDGTAFAISTAIGALIIVSLFIWGGAY